MEPPDLLTEKEKAAMVAGLCEGEGRDLTEEDIRAFLTWGWKSRWRNHCIDLVVAGALVARREGDNYRFFDKETGW